LQGFKNKGGERRETILLAERTTRIKKVREIEKGEIVVRKASTEKGIGEKLKRTRM
jgi:hypothetical protein